jgi:uncharacterized protein (DUF1015 family)
VADPAALRAAFAAVSRAYIADGHHRSAASFRAGMERRAADPAPDPAKEYNGFMACLFPASQLRILAYNRLLLTLGGHTPEEFLAEVARRFDVAPTDKPAPDAGQSCHLYFRGRWLRLAWDVPADATPVERLDVSILQDRLLGPVLGIDDPRTSKDIAFVGGIRGTDELVRAVDSGAAEMAFSMYPTTVAQMMAIADAGAIMPPKSTWFEPKLRSGLLVHELG